MGSTPFQGRAPCVWRPPHLDPERVAGRHQTARPEHDTARLEGIEEDVETEYRLDLRTVERSLLNHQFGAAILARRRTLFGRLEQEDDRAGAGLPSVPPGPRRPPSGWPCARRARTRA